MTLERIINHCLALDPYRDAHLEGLEGKVVAFSMADSELSLTVVFWRDRVSLVPGGEGEADVRLSGSPSDYLKMFAATREARPAFVPAVSIAGDVEVLGQLKKLIAELERLHRHETALTPALTYGPNRRVGALGAYIVSPDFERRRFPDRGEWISLR